MRELHSAECMCGSCLGYDTRERTVREGLGAESVTIDTTPDHLVSVTAVYGGGMTAIGVGMTLSDAVERIADDLVRQAEELEKSK